MRSQLDALAQALEGHSLMACLSVLEAVLAERAKYARPAPELVWTGPETTRALAREGEVVAGPGAKPAHTTSMPDNRSLDSSDYCSTSPEPAREVTELGVSLRR
jgi:hypothetical protein